MPDISVIVPTYQRRTLVLALLSALSAQEFDGSFEVIVVIDGSRDGTAEALKTTVTLSESKAAGMFTALGYRVITIVVASIGAGYYLTSRKEISAALEESKLEETETE